MNIILAWIDSTTCSARTSERCHWETGLVMLKTFCNVLSAAWATKNETNSVRLISYSQAASPRIRNLQSFEQPLQFSSFGAENEKQIAIKRDAAKGPGHQGKRTFHCKRCAGHLTLQLVIPPGFHSDKCLQRFCRCGMNILTCSSPKLFVAFPSGSCVATVVASFCLPGDLHDGPAVEHVVR